MAKLAVCTLVAKTQLPYARALALSLRQFHPDLPLYAVLLDQVEGCFDPAHEPFRLVLADELPVADLAQLRFAFDQTALRTRLLPTALAHLLTAYGVDRLLWLDPASQVTGSLTPVFDSLDPHAILLIPQLVQAGAVDTALATEHASLSQGLYSTSGLGVANSAPGRAMLAWWASRLATSDGLSYAWLDLAPSLFDGVHISRDPGVAVGAWNLHERRLHYWNGKLLVDSQPCRVVHFRGFDPYVPWAMAQTLSDRLTLDGSAVGALYWQYLNTLGIHGYHAGQGWGYTYDRFDNGIPIPPIARQLYRESGAAAKWGNPFHTAGPDTFWAWLNASVDGVAPHISQLWHSVYRHRSDLHAAFPDVLGAHRQAFRAWATQFGAQDMRIPPALLPY